MKKQNVFLWILPFSHRGMGKTDHHAFLRTGVARHPAQLWLYLIHKSSPMIRQIQVSQVQWRARRGFFLNVRGAGHSPAAYGASGASVDGADLDARR